MKKIGKAMQSSVEIIFLLSGNIFNLKDIVDKVKYNSMTIYIHLDLMEGFSSDYIALKYISEKI